MTIVLKARKELLASKVSNLVSDTNENLLRVNLTKFFTDLEAEIQKALMEYYNDTMLLQGQINLILAPIHEKHQEYYELIMRHKLQEFKRAKQSANRIVKREQKRVAMKSAKPVNFIHNRNNLFGTLKYSEDRLANNTFTASQNTLNRVDSNISQILTDGYKSGAGINEVGRIITERFDELRTWEANRIARTEIHTAQNMGIMSSYEDLGVEYTQWIAANDDRTRDSHIEVDGEIIAFGETYSNGLSFPGDTSGPIEEWINCRCSNAPFVMPAGKMAPSFSPFREEDLVDITAEVPQVTEPEPFDPIKQNLTDEEYKQYQKLQQKIESATERLNKAKPDDPRRVMYEANIRRDTKRLKKLEEMASNPSSRKVTTENILIKGGQKNVNLEYSKITTHEEMADYFGLTYVEEVTTQYGKSTARYVFYDEAYGTYIRGAEKFDILETKEVLRSYDRANPVLKSAVNGIHLDPTTKIKDLGTYNPASNTVTIFSHLRETQAATLEYTTNHELTHAFDNLMNSNFDKFFSQTSKEYRKIVRQEGWGSAYSFGVKGSTRITEDLAETGSMVLNRNNPNIKITLQDGRVVTAKEWCELFPKKTTFFEKMINSKEAQKLLVR